MRLWVLVFASCFALGCGLGFTDTLRDGFLRLHHRLTHSSVSHIIHKRQALNAFEEDVPDKQSPPEVATIDVEFKDDNETVEVKPKKTKRVGYAHLDLMPCGEEDDLLYVENLKMTPNPTVIPGPLTLQFQLNAKENISSPVGAELFMRKKVSLLFGLSSWFDIPCLEYPEGKVGSCEYEDVCPLGFLNEAICRDNNDLSTCGCPFLAGSYESRPVTFDIPSIPDNVPAYLLDGEFTVKGVLKKNGKIATCYTISVDFKSEIVEIEEDDETPIKPAS